MTTSKVTVFKVVEIIDRTTIAVGGPGIEELYVGAELFVLAVGPPVGSTGVPLVLPKAKLQVTLATPAYAIARPPIRTVERMTGWATLTQGEKVTVRERPALDVDEKTMRGNPANQPIQLGDPVILVSEQDAFIVALAAQASGQPKGGT